MTMPPLSPSDVTESNASRRAQSWTVKSATEIAYVRNQCCKYTIECGFSHRAELELSIAVTELMTNGLKFGTCVTLSINRVDSPRRGIRIVSSDDGPGFENIDLAPVDGYSDGRFLHSDDIITHRRGLGVGLGAVARLTDELTLTNPTQGGACVTIWKWLPSNE